MADEHAQPTDGDSSMAAPAQAPYLRDLLFELYRLYHGARYSITTANELDQDQPQIPQWAKSKSMYIWGVIAEIAISILLTFNIFAYWEHRSIHNYQGHYWYIVALINVAIIVGVFIYARSLYDLDRWVARRLPESGLAERLALGCSEAIEMYNRVPGFWRTLFLGSHPNTLRRAIKLVAYNLDWFLKPPNSYVRSSWVLLVAVIIYFVTVAILTIEMIHIKALDVTLVNDIALCCVMFFFQASRIRKNMFISHFVPYIFEHLRQ